MVSLPPRGPLARLDASHTQPPPPLSAAVSRLLTTFQRVYPPHVALRCSLQGPRSFARNTSCAYCYQLDDAFCTSRTDCNVRALCPKAQAAAPTTTAACPCLTPPRPVARIAAQVFDPNARYIADCRAPRDVLCFGSWPRAGRLGLPDVRRTQRLTFPNTMVQGLATLRKVGNATGTTAGRGRRPFGSGTALGPGCPRATNSLHLTPARPFIAPRWAVWAQTASTWGSLAGASSSCCRLAAWACGRPSTPSLPVRPMPLLSPPAPLALPANPPPPTSIHKRWAI